MPIDPPADLWAGLTMLAGLAGGAWQWLASYRGAANAAQRRLVRRSGLAAALLAFAICASAWLAARQQLDLWVAQALFFAGLTIACLGLLWLRRRLSLLAREEPVPLFIGA